MRPTLPLNMDTALREVDISRYTKPEIRPGLLKRMNYLSKMRKWLDGKEYMFVYSSRSTLPQAIKFVHEHDALAFKLTFEV